MNPSASRRRNTVASRRISAGPSHPPTGAARARRHPGCWGSARRRRAARRGEGDSLELALLHLREEVASLQVLVGRFGRKRRIVLALHLPLGPGCFRGVLLDQGSELLFIAL